ncbi:hypothetical protein ABTD62_22635, partial [Acinetobacter baumannii]
KTATGLLAGSSLGILGNPFWHQFRITVDYKNSRMFLERSAREKAAEELRSDLLKTEISYHHNFDSGAARVRLQNLLS